MRPLFSAPPGQLHIAPFADDAVVFHEPSGALVRVTPAMAAILDALTPQPRSVAELGADADTEETLEEALVELALQGLVERHREPR